MTDKGAAIQFAGPAHLVLNGAAASEACCGRLMLPAALALHGDGSSPGRAQQLDLAHGGPIAITAQRRDRVAAGTARGDRPRRRQGGARQNVTVTADRLIAYYRPKNGAAAQPTPPRRRSRRRASSVTPDTGGNEIYRLQAEGNVQIFTPTDQAWGDRAVYDIDQAVLVMTGHDLKLTTPNDVLTARDESGILVAEAHGGGARQCRRGDQRRTADRGRHAGRLHHRRASSRRRSARQRRRSPPAAGAADDPLAASGKLQKVEAFGNVTVRTVDRHRDRRPRRSTCRTPASRGWPAMCGSPAGRTSSMGRRRR